MLLRTRCASCSQSPLPGRSRCVVCAERHRNARRDRRIQLKEWGVCTSCEVLPVTLAADGSRYITLCLMCNARRLSAIKAAYRLKAAHAAESL